MTPLPPPEAPPGPATAPVAAPGRLRPERMLLVLCGLGSVVGAYLPWASVSAGFIDPVNKAGIDGDGRLTLAVGVVVGLLGLTSLLRPRDQWPGGLALVGAAVIVIIALVNVADLRSVTGPLTPEARALVDISVGVGLWLTLVAGLVGVAGGVVSVLPIGGSGGRFRSR